MPLLLILLLVASLAWMQTPGLPELGASAEALRLRNAAGSPLPLDTLTADGPLLLIVFAARSSAEFCEAAQRLAAVPAPAGIERVLASPASPSTPPDCPAVATRIAHLDNIPATIQPAALLVDDSLHVRLRLSLEPGQSSWNALGGKLAQWLQGRQTYEANCGHCHGFDGAQASAPETKTLVGITRKYPESRVLELGSQFGGVDMTGWSDNKKETLLAYLRGL